MMGISSHIQRPHTPVANTTPPGTLTAHERFYLVLLCSQPDTVRRFPLRETKLHHCIAGPTMYGFYSLSFSRSFVNCSGKENA